MSERERESEGPRSQPEQPDFASRPSSSSRPSSPSPVPVPVAVAVAQTRGVGVSDSERRPPAPAQRNSPSSARSLPPGAGYASTFTAQPELPPPPPQLPLMSLGGWDSDPAPTPTPADGKSSMLDTVLEAENTSELELEELAPPARERAATTPADLSARNSLPLAPPRQQSDPIPQRSSLESSPKPGGTALSAEPASYLPTTPATSRQDDAPSTSQPPISESLGPRPSLPLPPVVRSNSLASERSQDYALPLQFPPTATDRVRPSTIPAFVPALAFSANDRGPYPPTSSYPPHVRSSAQPASSSGPRESIYAGMDGPYPAPAPATSFKGKGRASDEVELNRRASQFYSNQVAGARDDVLAQSQPASAQPPPERVPRVTSPGGAGGEFRDSMVGVGRNSIIRSGGALSPTSQNLLLGPAPSGRNSPPTAAAAQYAQQQQQSPPPHLVQQPEICVECMMRDRDMIDVDVTGDGVWERESDQDFDEAMRWDEESVERGSDESTGQRARRGTGSREPSLAGGSRDSHTGRGSMYGAPPRKKLGKGQPLTAPSLKLWTSMNPPASAHRWRTLQAFLATQIQLLELERHAREATAAERERERHGRPSTDSRQSGSPLLGSIGRHKSASTLLPNGLVVESINVDRDEKQGRARAKSRSQALDERASYHQPTPGATLSPDDNVRMYASGDQPWLAAQPRRFSSPALKDGPGGRPSSATSFKGFGLGKFARSSTDLRSLASPRSISPGRASLGVDDRRGSMWSKFRQSASQSVLSLAPSGSMMDMHLGMSMDKHAQQHAHTPYNRSHPAHAYPLSMSDPAVARHADVERGRVMALAAHAQEPSKPKKKGIKGFFSKLMAGADSSGKQRHGISATEPGTPSVPLGLGNHESGDYLVPPPPLSALANEPQYHNRSLSNSSVDSIQQPFTPPQSSRGPTPAGGHPYSIPTDFMRPGGLNSLADRGSIMTNGSFSSVRSKPGSTTSPVPGRNSFQRPSIDYLSPEPSPPRHSNTFLPRSSSPDQVDLEREEEILYASVRREKSLPSLPSEAATTTDPAATFPFPLQHTQSNLPYSSLRDTRSAYSIRTPSLSPPRALGGEDWDDDARSDVGGGRKSKARSKVWSMNFGALAARKKGAGARPSTEHVEKGDTVVREAALEGIRREGGLVSVRF